MKEERTLFVGSTTNTNSLGSSIYASITTEKLDYVKLRAIGAGATNQAVKGIIKAKSLLMQRGVSISIDMNFRLVEEDISANEFHLRVV